MYWSGGVEAVQKRLQLLSKVLGTLPDPQCHRPPVATTSVMEMPREEPHDYCPFPAHKVHLLKQEVLWYQRKILSSLVLYYQHDTNTLRQQYHKVIGEWCMDMVKRQVYQATGTLMIKIVAKSVRIDNAMDNIKDSYGPVYYTRVYNSEDCCAFHISAV